MKMVIATQNNFLAAPRPLILLRYLPCKNFAFKKESACNS